MQASTTHDGDGVDINTNIQAYLTQFQCVTSHGNETVSDAKIPTHVAYLPGMAVLAPANYNPSDSRTKRGMVHVPIHNPPTLTKTPILEDIIVRFDSSGDATIDSVAVYYDTTSVFKVGVKKSGTFYVKLSNAEASSAAYVKPIGICVTLDLRFPEADSSIDLYSVTLVYKAT
jgi:hypothetical protein